MVKDLLNYYGKYFETDNVALDNYSLSEGIYIVINKDGSIKFEREIKNKKERDYSDEYEYIKERDFYSNMINADKAINTNCKNIKEYSTGKKILSNNIYTLFFNTKVLLNFKDPNKELKGEEEKKTLPTNTFIEVIKQYFASLKVLGSEKKEDKKILEYFKVDKINLDIANKNLKIFIDNIEKIILNIKENYDVSKDIKIKIFIEEDLEIYKQESFRYISIKIFNKNDYNKLSDSIYGMNGFNFSMNDKKPFLELKTTSYKVGSRLSIEEVLKLKNMYEWFAKNTPAYPENSPDTYIQKDFDFKGDYTTKEKTDIMLLNVKKAKEGTFIENIDNIPVITNDMKEPIVFYNYINNNKLIDSITINKLDELEKYVSKIWYSKLLTSVYFNKKSILTKDVKILAKYKKDSLLNYGNILYNFFHKLDDEGIKNNINKIGRSLIFNTLFLEITTEEFKKYGKLPKTTEQTILYLKLKEYLNKGDENMEDKLTILRDKTRSVLNTDDIIKTDTEFLFITGQAIYYLLTKSKADKVAQNLLDPFLNTSNVEVIKKQLIVLYQKYNYEISLKNKRFNNMFSKILAYNFKGNKIDSVELLIGILSDNLCYEKGGIINDKDE